MPESSFPIQAPSLVGPDIYELFTDASYFSTRVFVNEKELSLSNAEGYGSLTRNGFSACGAMGYKNKLFLNGHLKAGKNKIEVLFEPSSIVDTAKKEDVESLIIRDMYAHALLVQGRLTDDTSGEESYDLDQLLLEKSNNIKVLKNTLFRRFNTKILEEKISVTHNFTLPDTAKSVQAPISSCRLSSNSSSNFIATLSLNNTPIMEINNTSTMTLENFSDTVIEGINVFDLHVTGIENSPETRHINLYIEYDFESRISDIGFSESDENIKFGDFFNRIYTPLVNYNFNKTGNYSLKFNFKL